MQNNGFGFPKQDFINQLHPAIPRFLSSMGSMSAKKHSTLCSLMEPLEALVLQFHIMLVFTHQL